MQTFLPYKSFKKSAETLDYQRLGKQRVEAMQIINVIEATCISGDAGAAWFVEAHLFGDGTIATPFADQ